MNTFKTKAGTELPLLNMKGKDYLEVKYRLVWFREEHPDWGIVTQIIEISDKHCVVRAEIRDTNNRVVSMGHKYEDRQGFADFREKAETGSIGRALGCLGYGTQFAPELDEGERIVDSPAERRKPKNPLKPVKPALQDTVDSIMKDKAVIKGRWLGTGDKADCKPADYLIPVTEKLHGKRMGDVPLSQLKAILDWYEAKMVDGSIFGPKHKEFIDYARRYLKEKDSEFEQQVSNEVFPFEGKA